MNDDGDEGRWSRMRDEEEAIWINWVRGTDDPRKSIGRMNERMKGVEAQ